MGAAERYYVHGWLVCMLIVFLVGCVFVALAIAGRDPSDPTVQAFVGLTSKVLGIGFLVLVVWSVLAISWVYHAPREITVVKDEVIAPEDHKRKGQFSLLDLMDVLGRDSDPAGQMASIVKEGNVIRVSFGGGRSRLRPI